MRSIAIRSQSIFRSSILAGAVLAFSWLLLGSPTGQKEAIPQDGHPQTPWAKRHARWFQLGRASWYGPSFQGQTTASGETFDMYQMTCAHRSLPLGALVRVTNLHNHRSVVVRVNDRGPLVGTRIVDLSYAAARILGVHGMARVRLDLIDPSPSRAEVASLSVPERSGN